MGDWAPAEGRSGRRRRIGLVIAGAVSLVVLGGLAAVVLFDADKVLNPSMHRYWVPSVSMEPTIYADDHVWAREIDGDDVERGDIVIVIVDSPVASEDVRTTVKRVVAASGDEVSTRGGQLALNGRLFDEPYLSPGTSTTDVDDQVVPVGHVFLMGDNRNNALDSRRYGPVPTEDIVARVD